MDNPTGGDRSADVFKLPEELAETPERARPAPRAMQEDSDSSSSDSDSSSSSSDSSENVPERVVQLRGIVGSRELAAHAVRGAVHILDGGSNMKT
eukprot:11188731-Lingulodinium_polyedra.AAC.1